MTTLHHALAYASAGFSVIPIVADGSKRPALASWKEFQHRIALPEQIKTWYDSHPDAGVAIICGMVSDGLEVLDFDNPSAWTAFVAAADAAFPGLLATLPLVATPRQGFHVYLCGRKAVEGNRKLSRGADRKVQIETRGEGGYVLAPGCSAACHPSGKLYTWMRLLEGVALS